MSRESADEFRAGRLWDGYDYTNQAWVRNGRYVNCGHPKSMSCTCYGRLHMGERTRRTETQIDRCEHGEHDYSADVYTNFGTELVPGERGCSNCGAIENESSDGHTKENASALKSEDANPDCRCSCHLDEGGKRLPPSADIRMDCCDKTTSALDRAIAYLGAVQVADPDPAHTSPLYAYRDPAGSGRYAVMSADYLLLAHDTDDPLVLMPHWWTPERRFAALAPNGEICEVVAAKADAIHPYHDFITADLETGEEISA